VWQAIETAISRATGAPFKVISSSSLAGGCINQAVCLVGEGRRYFVKLNQADRLEMFTAEAAGLDEIRRSRAIRAPEPICMGTSEGQGWLVLEFISMGSPGQETSTLLGKQLADMHRHTAPSFGWSRDNTIGTTPQNNHQTQDWIAFQREHRIGFQLELAGRNGAPATLLERGQRLLHELPALFTDYQPQASLLHGDLWGGNWGCSVEGAPVIFDPAVYYGDREADLAMTELFGGFDDRFYQSYRQVWTVDPGYKTRKVVYNLYHILNHYNLFGGGYARQALGMVDALISEIS
jgi:protein-ribulosamine 3-kinase